MTLTTVTIGKLDREKADAIELYDEDAYNFFRETAGDNYSVYVDSSLFSKDAKQQRAFLLFAENFHSEIAGLPSSLKRAHEASITVGKILSGVKQDIVQFEIPISQARFEQLGRIDSKDYDFLENTGPVTLNGDTLVLARIRFDLSHYFNVDDYQKAVDEFTRNVRDVYDQALAEGNRTLEEIDPDLANFIRFCSFPDIHFDLAMSEQRFSEVSAQFDPDGSFLKRQGRMTLPNDPETYVRARLVIHASDLKSDPAKRDQLQAFAIAVLGYYDRLMAEGNRQVEELDVDMRNFYRILSAYRNFPKQGELTADAMVTPLVIPDDQAALEEAFEGATVGTAAPQPASSSGHPAPAAGQSATTGPLKGTSGPAASGSTTTTSPPPPPREKSPVEKAIATLQADYPVGGKTRGELIIIENSSTTDGQSVSIGVYATRGDGRPVQIFPVSVIEYSPTRSEAYLKSARAAAKTDESLRLLSAPAGRIGKRLGENVHWAVTFHPEVTVRRDGTVKVKFTKVMGQAPPQDHEAFVAAVKLALERITWPVDDSVRERTFKPFDKPLILGIGVNEESE